MPYFYHPLALFALLVLALSASVSLSVPPCLLPLLPLFLPLLLSVGQDSQELLETQKPSTMLIQSNPIQSLHNLGASQGAAVIQDANQDEARKASLSHRPHAPGNG